MKTTILKTTLLLVALTFLNCTSTDAPQDQLPPITQTGANTFGCIINGKVLMPKDSRGSLGGVNPRNGITAEYDSNNNFIIDAGNFRDNNGDRIYIYIYNLTSIGTYSFGLSTGQSSPTFEPTYSHSWSIISQTSKFISNANSGIVKITQFDTSNKIVSGTFNNLTLVNIDDSNDIIQITDGRFDINLNTVNN